MTRVHPVQHLTLLRRKQRCFEIIVLALQQNLVFFEPRGDGMTRYAKGSFDATQTHSLIVSRQNLGFELVAIGRVGLFAATPTTPSAAITLLAIAGLTISNQLLAATVTAQHGDYCFSLH